MFYVVFLLISIYFNMGVVCYANTQRILVTNFISFYMRSKFMLCKVVLTVMKKWCYVIGYQILATD